MTRTQCVQVIISCQSLCPVSEPVIFKRTVFLIRTIKNTILFYFTLYRISLASLIRHCRIHTGLLGCSVLEEFLRYSREQRVG